MDINYVPRITNLPADAERQAELCGKQNPKCPLSEEWLQHERDYLKMRPLITGTADDVRNAAAGFCRQLEEIWRPADSYNVTDHKDWTDAGQAVRVYTPKHVTSSTKLPVGIYCHGGGHVIGGAWRTGFEDRMCRYIADNANVVMIFVDFRLAPEYVAPTQVDDCLSAFKWAYNNPARVHGDTSRYFAFGSSVGGALAFGVALKLADEGKGDWCKGIVSLMGATVHPQNVPEEHKARFTAYDETWNDVPMQDGESMMVFYAMMGGTDQKANPYVWPLLHPGVKDLPPVYQSVCECDPLRDDAVIMKDLLDKHGVENYLDMWEGQPHAFWVFPQLKSSDPYYHESAEGTKWVVNQMNKPKANGEKVNGAKAMVNGETFRRIKPYTPKAQGYNSSDSIGNQRGPINGLTSVQ